MELFSDLYDSIDILKHLLESSKYKTLYFGITLQAYLPESFEIQQQLTKWAIHRVESGGNPIKIRLVKGANLTLETIIANQNFNEIPMYRNKSLVDYNFKRMVQYGLVSSHAHAAHIGVGSHNIFDVAFTLIERSEKNTEQFVSFEMINGLSDTLYKTLQLFTENILIYSPTIHPKNLDLANSYLFRRIDEQTHPENFLRNQFNLEPGNKTWMIEVDKFKTCFSEEGSLKTYTNMEQKRTASIVDNTDSFQNTPCTNWSLKVNRDSINKFYQIPEGTIPKMIPFTVGKTLIYEAASYLSGINPNNGAPFYTAALINNDELDDVFTLAKKTLETEFIDLVTYQDWAKKSIELIEKNRQTFCALMSHEVAKPLIEADLEVNEAVDFINYYMNQRIQFNKNGLTVIPKGIGLVCSPWNFPLAIPLGCIFSSLICGNVVLFKPAPEACLVGWHLCKLLWDAGIPKERLQFIPCSEALSGQKLITHPNLNYVSLTGSDQTAQHFLSLKPTLDLIAETGGKNAIIISNICDTDEAIQDVLKSAFSFAGQKCSACSLLLCHKDVLKDSKFLLKLKEACQSLITSSALNKGCVIPPIIRKAKPTLEDALTKLNPEEKWLVQPKQNPDNPLLWTPGIKLGIKENSHFAQTECFGPILGIAEISSFQDGIRWINNSKYGLTAGLHSLDEDEQLTFIKHTKAGNLYINKATTGAIVGLQPFGGRRYSSFGNGYKAGGEHYLNHYCTLKNTSKVLDSQLPKLPDPLIHFSKICLKETFISFCSQVNHFQNQLKDLKKVKINRSRLGEDNICYCESKSQFHYRISSQDSYMDLCLIVAFCKSVSSALTLSFESELFHNTSVQSIKKHLPATTLIENKAQFNQRISTLRYLSIRSINYDMTDHLPSIHKHHHQLISASISTNTRIECLYLLNEKTISRKSHRYGYLE